MGPVAHVVALLAAIAAAPAPASVAVTATVATERPVAAVSVRAFALGEAAVRRPELVRTPLKVWSPAPGAVVLSLEQAWFPLRLEVTAAGHLAAVLDLLEPSARALPALWLPTATTTRVQVLADGSPVPAVVVRGELAADEPWVEGAWRPVVPSGETDATGTLEVRLPATGEASFSALAADGRWGSRTASLPAAGTLRCALASGPLAVVVRNTSGEPVVGARVAVVGAPAGSVALTDAAGRAVVQGAKHGPSVVTALAAGCGARAVAYPGGRAPLAMTCAPLASLRVTWTGGGAQALVTPGWLPAALLGGAPLRLAGGRGELPFFGSGGTLAAWSPGSAGRSFDVADGAASASLRFAAAAGIEGTVVDVADRPVAGVPVWRWTLPEDVLAGRIRSMSNAGMLERAVLPGGVSDDHGRFTVSPLAPALARVVAVQAGKPPADSGPLELSPGRREQLVLKLEGGTWLALITTDPEGRPLAGVASSLAPNPDAHGGHMTLRLGGSDRSLTERIAEGSSDREGKLLLRGVRAGAVKLHLSLPGYVTRTVDLEVPAAGLDAGALVLQPGVTVLGRVVDDRAAAVAGAEVFAGNVLGAFGPALTTSDDTGAFAVADRPREGETYLSARAGGGSSEPVRVALPPQGPVELVIKSRRELSGRVVDEASAAPVSGAKVSASRTLKMETGAGGMHMAFMVSDGTDEVESDADGRFRLAGVAAGSEYTLKASARGYRTLEQQVKVPEREAPRPVTVRLKPGLAIRGTVSDAEGSPAAGVTVDATPATHQGGMVWSEHSATARSGDDGSFLLEGLDPGRFELHATGEDGATAREVVEAGRDEPVELQLRAAGTIDGRVVAEDGAPVAGATVRGHSGRNMIIDPVRSAGDGAFVTGHLEPGTYQVMASAEGWATAQSQVAVEAGRSSTVTLTLKRGGTVTGHVLGLAAGEMERCNVFTSGAGTKPTADGSFTLTGVPLGPGEVGAMVLPDGRRRTAKVDLESLDQPVTVDLDFASGLHLSGSVRRRGTPVPGVIVEAAGSGSSASGATTTSDAQGQWELGGIEPGQVEVRALDRQSNVLAARSLAVTGDARVDLDVPGGTIAGWVVALPDRSPLAGARVTASGEGAAAVSRAAQTDSSGTFTLDELPDGDLLLRGEADGYTPALSRVTVSMGAARDVTLALEEEKRLRLLLRLADGSVPDMAQLLPVLGGRVDDPIWVTCDRDGRASVGSLPSGAYTFLITAGEGLALVALPVPSAETAVMLQPSATLRAATPAGQAWRLRVVSAGSGLAMPVGPWQNPGRGEWLEVRGGLLALRVPAGTWVVQGVGPDGSASERRVAVPPEGDVVVTLP